METWVSILSENVLMSGNTLLEGYYWHLSQELNVKPSGTR